QGFAIGRIYFTNPSASELFYLRLLLTTVHGSQSFDHLKTVGNIVHPTFKSACLALGLLETDSEWIQCLEEASVLRTSSQLRTLFAIILMHCAPSHPEQLWLRFHEILHQSGQSLKENQEFAYWLLEENDKLSLPYYMKILPQSLESLIGSTYPNIHLTGTFLNLLPGNQHTYISADNSISENGANNNNIYPTEFLNSLSPKGLPLAKLNLKIG
ncbi:3341_t:CDS:2, partial [Dentiscutata heterogama]